MLRFCSGPATHRGWSHLSKNHLGISQKWLVDREARTRLQHTLVPPVDVGEYISLNEYDAAQGDQYMTDIRPKENPPREQKKEDVNGFPTLEYSRAGRPLQRDFFKTGKIYGPHDPALREVVERENCMNASEKVPVLDEHRKHVIQIAQQEIRAVLAGEDDWDLLERIWDITKDDDIMASIPSSTFAEILRRAEPSDEFLPFREDFAERFSKNHIMLGGRIQRNSQDIDRRKAILVNLWEKRTQSGRTLSTREYAQILRFARGAYDGLGASIIMREMIRQNVKPDLACYNYYFEAKCWSDAWYPDERQRLRVIPWTRRQREQRESRVILRGIRIHPHKVGAGGLKEEVTDVFTHMIEGGIVPDSGSYGHLITALAREGNIQGVKATLKSTWDIDVDAIGYGSRTQASSIPTNSPLHPDQSLLFIIAHAFGSNNDLPTALRVVGNVSEKFNISVPTAVWAELLEWAYTLSTRRYKTRKFDGTQIGQLAPQTVEDLFKVLTNEPYNCKPTLSMVDQLVRSMARRDYLSPMLDYILEGLKLHDQDCQHYVSCVRSMPSQPDQQQVRTAQQLRDKRFASFVTIHRWFLALVSGQRWFHGDPTSETTFWQRQLLPDVIGLFWRFRDFDGVAYTMDTGFVNLKALGSSSSPELYKEYGQQTVPDNRWSVEDKAFDPRFGTSPFD